MDCFALKGGAWKSVMLVEETVGDIMSVFREQVTSVSTKWEENEITLLRILSRQLLVKQ